jgi:hypothetical protein
MTSVSATRSIVSANILEWWSYECNWISGRPSPNNAPICHGLIMVRTTWNRILSSSVHSLRALVSSKASVLSSNQRKNPNIGKIHKDKGDGGDDEYVLRALINTY